MKATVVRDLMTTDPITLSEDEDFTSANQIMKLERIRHLPVVKGSRLVGLVTHRDLLGAQTTLLLALADRPADGEEQYVSVRVAEIMSEALLTCAPTTPVDDAARMMLDTKTGCMLVVEDEALVGILTETDVMAWAIEVMAKLRFETEPPGSGSGG